MCSILCFSDFIGRDWHMNASYSWEVLVIVATKWQVVIDELLLAPDEGGWNPIEDWTGMISRSLLSLNIFYLSVCKDLGLRNGGNRCESGLFRGLHNAFTQGVCMQTDISVSFY